MTNKKPMHPVLVGLQLDKETVNRTRVPSALDVLNYLLETTAISDDAVRSAYSALLLATKPSVVILTENADVAAAADGDDVDKGVGGGHPCSGAKGALEKSLPPHKSHKRKATPNANMADSASTSSTASTNTEKNSPVGSTDGTAAAAAATATTTPLPDAAKNNNNNSNTNTARRRHVALRIYYDGAAYSGLAENVGTASDASIERALFAALARAHLLVTTTKTTTTTTSTTTSREACGYSRCGRTDKGVSATGQVVALHLKSAFALEAMLCDPSLSSPATMLDESMHLSPNRSGCRIENKDLPKNSHEKLTVWVPPKQKKKGNEALPVKNSAEQLPWVQKELSEYAYDKILNQLLPPDIRVLGWIPVSDDFSARFSCTTRTYRYFFVPRATLNLDQMLQGLQLMVGAHDFRNFCKMDVEKVYNFERKIHSAEIVSVDPNTCYISIVGQAFLWHQIRCIAHVLFLIGRGLEEPSLVSELLDVEKNPGKPSYALADERPLVLHDCQYSNLRVGYSVPNLWNIVCQQEQQWEDFCLAAARVRNCIESLHGVAVSTGELSDFCASKLKQREKKKNKGLQNNDSSGDDALQVPFSSGTVTWREALVWLNDQGLTPDPNKTTEFVYTPLLERSKGSTYEEKVAALLNSSRRRVKFENNVIKKRKTKAEDAAFYEHMSKQGGSAV